MKIHPQIDGRLRDFILAQPVFFVGTAPTSTEGHVNISPKGLTGSLAVLDPHRVAYLDYLGSGAETVAHLRDNGRIVLMFCAFTGPPNIVRLHGHGVVHLPRTPGFVALRGAFAPSSPLRPRAIIEVEVSRVSDSCGFAVPFLRYEGDRDLLDRYWAGKSPEQIEEYEATRNGTSIDGLPSMRG